MKHVTVRRLRLEWPRVERELVRSGEILVTRDSRPVARILPYVERSPTRRRFDADEHLRWLRRFWKGRRSEPPTDEALHRERADD